MICDCVAPTWCTAFSESAHDPTNMQLALAACTANCVKVSFCLCRCLCRCLHVRGAAHSMAQIHMHLCIAPSMCFYVSWQLKGDQASCTCMPVCVCVSVVVCCTYVQLHSMWNAACPVANCFWGSHFAFQSHVTRLARQLSMWPSSSSPGWPKSQARQYDRMPFYCRAPRNRAKLDIKT